MDSKENLLVAVMRSTMEPLIASDEPRRPRNHLPEEALVTLVELHVWSHGTDPDR